MRLVGHVRAQVNGASSWMGGLLRAGACRAGWVPRPASLLPWLPKPHASMQSSGNCLITQRSSLAHEEFTVLPLPASHLNHYDKST